MTDQEIVDVGGVMATIDWRWKPMLHFLLPFHNPCGRGYLNNQFVWIECWCGKEFWK